VFRPVHSGDINHVCHILTQEGKLVSNSGSIGRILKSLWDVPKAQEIRRDRSCVFPQRPDPTVQQGLAIYLDVWEGPSAVEFRSLEGRHGNSEGRSLPKEPGAYGVIWCACTRRRERSGRRATYLQKDIAVCSATVVPSIDA
jgi:hypothetical protein